MQTIITFCGVVGLSLVPRLRLLSCSAMLECNIVTRGMSVRLFICLSHADIDSKHLPLTVGSSSFHRDQILYHRSLRGLKRD